MALIDERGRLFGRINLVDLFVVLFVCAAGAVAYSWLTPSYRVAPPYSLSSKGVWIEVDLYVESELAWIGESLTPGQVRLDPRSGRVMAEILGTEEIGSHGGLVVHTRLQAVGDEAGRYFFQGKTLVPGQEIRIETDESVIEGRVYRIGAEVDGPAQASAK